MKKLLSAVLVVMLLVVSVFSVSAAGDINDNEQKILDLLATKVEVGESHAEIPAEYIAQAKSYFMTLDVNKTQADEIIAILKEGIETGKKALEDAEHHGKHIVSLKDFTQAEKEHILECGQEACEVIDLTLTYIPADNHVEIVANETGKTVFVDDAVIKTTGADSLAPLFVVAGAIVVLMVAAFVIKRREA